MRLMLARLHCFLTLAQVLSCMWSISIAHGRFVVDTEDLPGTTIQGAAADVSRRKLSQMYQPTCYSYRYNCEGSKRPE